MLRLVSLARERSTFYTSGVPARHSCPWGTYSPVAAITPAKRSLMGWKDVSRSVCLLAKERNAGLHVVNKPDRAICCCSRGVS